MKEQPIHEDPKILAAAERQMHAWALTAELKDRAIRHDAETRSTPGALQCVAISREAGAGGGAIAQCLGRRLGWEVFDKNLLDVVLAAARRGHAVFVGRGAQFLLQPGQMLAVRIVASAKYRLRQIVARTGLKEHEALRYMLEVDRGRREFVERFFHRDVADSHHYNLVINAERCGKESTVAEILAALGIHTQ